MAKMDEKRLLAIVDGEFHSSMGAASGEISTERAKAWDYYLSKPFGNEIEDRSQFVTSDVADVVDGIMPSLLRTFTTAENLVDFDAVGPEDVDQSAQESDYVNHVFFKRNPAFEIMHTWFLDGLLQKNGIVKAWWDESEEVTTESYQGLTDDDLAELLDDDELEAVERDQREGKTIETVLTLQGEVQQEVEATLHDVVFKRTSKTGRVRIEPVPPEEYRISSDARSLDPGQARMVGHEREVTRSELIEMGFDRDLVESLPSTSDSEDSSEEIARRDKSDDDRSAEHDSSQDMIEIREAYLKVDFDGDGRSELRQVMTAGSHILSNEEVDRQPFHVISPHPLPHKHFGQAAAEKVMDVQKVNSVLVRQILDNLYHANNPGHAVWEQAIGENTLDDLLTTRIGGIKRFERPVNESWQPLSVPFVAGQTFPMLEFWEKTKRDRTGVSSDAEGLKPQELKNIQSSVLAQASDIARMKIETIVRIFAETGIKSLFLHIHELLLKHQKKVEVAKLRGQWVEVDPREWRTRRNMTVKVGVGIGSKEQNLLHLETIWDKQKQMLESGGLNVTVTPQNIFNTAAEFVKNANLKNPETFFTEPTDQPQQQPQGPSAQEQLAAQQLELQKREQDLDRERNLLQHQREIRKIEQNQEKLENDLRVKLEEIANKLTELDLEHPTTEVPGSRA